MSQESRRIIYSCPFVPAEWIAAHGLTPARIRPKYSATSSIGLAAGVCSYARAFAETAIEDNDARAAVVTTLCDQMRRISEVIEESTDLPLFLMQVPATWESANAQRAYVSELERLGRFLVRLGGETPSTERLSETMKAYDSERLTLRNSAEPASGGVPIALIGGPMMDQHMSIFDIIRSLGGSFALDGTETGERGLPAKFDRRRVGDEPLQVLADAYFGSIPDASRRPNSMLYRWLAGEIKSRGIRGVILIRHIWCDSWHAESSRIKEWLDLPFLDLDLGESGGDIHRLTTRIQAFMGLVK